MPATEEWDENPRGVAGGAGCCIIQPPALPSTSQGSGEDEPANKEFSMTRSTATKAGVANSAPTASIGSERLLSIFVD